MAKPIQLLKSHNSSAYENPVYSASLNSIYTTLDKDLSHESKLPGISELDALTYSLVKAEEYKELGFTYPCKLYTSISAPTATGSRHNEEFSGVLSKVQIKGPINKDVFIFHGKHTPRVVTAYYPQGMQNETLTLVESEDGKAQVKILKRPVIKKLKGKQANYSLQSNTFYSFSNLGQAIQNTKFKNSFSQMRTLLNDVDIFASTMKPST